MILILLLVFLWWPAARQEGQQLQQELERTRGALANTEAELAQSKAENETLGSKVRV